MRGGTLLLLASGLIGCVDGEVGDLGTTTARDTGVEATVEIDSAPRLDTSPLPDTAPAPAEDTTAPPEAAVDTAPPPPTKLPLPDMSKTVEEVGKAHPDWVARSCQKEGGTWELMDAIVDELRKKDPRWGYNWKRGVIGDPSNDAIDYHWGTGPAEGSKDVYIIDVVIGHCGPTPSAGWIDVTEATAMGGTIGIWTGRGRF